MEEKQEAQPLPDQIPLKFSKEEVEGKLTDEELTELNGLVEDFPNFSGDEDPRYKRWLELDTRAKA